MTTSPDVIVVGGGVIGCSTAYHLARAGVRTLVLERGRLGAQASSAASGVLSVAPGPHPYARLGRESLALFHKLAGELQEAGGVDMELAECGELTVAASEGAATELRAWVERHNELGGSARWLDRQAVHELEPELAPGVLGGMLVPEVCRVNNQRLSEAFARAAMRLGAVFRQGVEVLGLPRQGQRVMGVRLYDQDLHAGHVVLAAGSWTRPLAALAGVDIPVRPVRGQNLNLQPVSGGIKTVINAGMGLFVPRNDGSIIAGVTIEEAGYDARVTAEGVRSILETAIAVLPSLRGATLNWAIAGLRPGSPDDMPILGPVPGVDGLAVASGHYRNGILLSAITGHLIASHITGGDVSLMRPFGLDRFRR